MRGNIFNYSYNLTNGLISGASCSAINAFYAFDDLDRVTEISWKDASGNAVRSFGYGYNAVGLITRKVTAADSLQTTNLYEYDGLDRLVSESFFSPQASASSLFSYDLAGNRTQMVANGRTISYTLSVGNRLVSWGTNGQQKFDLAGNVTNIQYENGRKLSLKWDKRYRVTSVYTNGGRRQRICHSKWDYTFRGDNQGGTMKKLQSHETDLIGEWMFVNGKMAGNLACERIEYLIANVLKEVSKDASGWDVLYKDPTDGRYWELIYPKSHMQGGGPPRLTCISVEQAKSKYGDKITGIK